MSQMRGWNLKGAEGWGRECKFDTYYIIIRIKNDIA